MNYFIIEKNKTSLLNKVFIKIENTNGILELPVNLNDLYEKSKNKKIVEKYINKLVFKLKKIIKNDFVVLSKSITSNKKFVEELEKNNINIYNGKWLYKYILKEIVEYILKEKKEIKENTEISFLVNYIDDVVIENIKIFAKEYKRINIVTNHIERFRRIEEDLYNENGIIITISNNKRKSLAKLKIIINMDFPNELINKYNIYEKAIIINLEDKIKINKKRFSGIIINDYTIELNEEFDIIDEYDKKEVFESLIYRKDNFFNIRKDIEKNGLCISEVFGNNGIIKLQKLL